MLDHPALDLPPALSLLVPPPGTGAFAFACREAVGAEAGTLVWSPGHDDLDVAVVLGPAEPLRSARRAFLVCMGALVQALASVAPPDKPLAIDWPDTIRFDGATLGGGRLGWPRDTAEEAVPAFLVFGATLTIRKDEVEPGFTPASTSFDEEGFESGADRAVVEAFGRYLMRGFDAWREESFEAAAAGYLVRLSGRQGARPTTDRDGNLLVSDSAGGRMELLPALRQTAWLDGRTGRPRS